MAEFPVKWMDNTMQGAPQVTTANGDLTAMLDACLSTGFDLRSVAGITRTDSTATVTVSGGHLYKVNQIVRIAGCDQDAYNGDQRVLSVSANTLTFAVAGAPASPATGSSISIRTAPLGFEIAFSGTHKRAYRSLNVESNRPLLRVDDGLDPAYNAAYAKKGKVTLCQGMSDIDTVVGYQAPWNPDFPTRNHVATGSGASVSDGWFKWYYAASLSSRASSETTAPPTGDRSWLIVGDDRMFYLLLEAHPGLGRHLFAFGEFLSWRVGDACNSILVACDAWRAANAAWSTAFNSNYTDAFLLGTRTNNATGRLALASYTQIGPPQPVRYISVSPSGANFGSGRDGGVPAVNGPDYGLLLTPVYLQQVTPGDLLGVLPGLRFILNNGPSVNHLDVLLSVEQSSIRQFLLAQAQDYQFSNLLNSSCVAFDLTGPWR